MEEFFIKKWAGIYIATEKLHNLKQTNQNWCEITNIDPWIIEQIANIISEEESEINEDYVYTPQAIYDHLNEFVIDGIVTSIDLHKKILSHEKFLTSDFDTNWMGKEKFF